MRMRQWMKIGLAAAIVAQAAGMQPASAQAQAVKILPEQVEMQAAKLQPKTVQSPPHTAYAPPEKHAEAAAVGDRERLEQQTDEFMKTAMDKYHVPGVTLAVVKDGAVLLEKGYGYADMEAKVPVDPFKTRFSIASVSKVFTATAAMQLAEQGKLDLAADVNRYLPDSLQVDNPYQTPLTMKHLLTNTGGFANAEQREGAWSDTVPVQRVPLEQTVKKLLPPLVRAPGDAVQYSNEGFTLAGYIVERASGLSYDDYIRQHIFAPLHMDNSLTYLTPERLNQQLAQGYSYDQGFVKMKQGEVLTYPAGSIWSTADDMGKFVLAHLQGGGQGENSILRQNTAKQMHSLQYSAHPLMPGYAYGFFQNYKNPAILVHPGDTEAFSSLLSIMPSRGIGFFIGCNSQYEGDDGTLRDAFEKQFYSFFGVSMDQPLTTSTGEAPEPAASIQSYAGTYAMVISEGLGPGVSKLRYRMMTPAVTVSEQGEVTLKSAGEELNGPYTPVGKRIFYNKRVNKYLVLKEGDSGSKYLVLDTTVPYQAFVKLDSWEAGAGGLAWKIALAGALLGLIAGVIAICRRKKPGAARMRLRHRLPAYFIAPLIFGTAAVTLLGVFSESRAVQGHWLLAANILAAGAAAGIACSVGFAVKYGRSKKLHLLDAAVILGMGLAGASAIFYMYLMKLLLFV
ncbi:serine hydrolase domain-containing protein [Paenibacillus graminis]|uniref:serine hydrolase domain-containing protein n=1 Tax=Paenibacillus graminis TaxID=189425 RepID=UPI002DBCEAE5|nr:serine hydrolase domain-containing protein [Paenibacillus graminis]MEC0169527.1 serine hydrolase [Paenibacillus graminis]